jgi:hypothetical protein
MRKRRGLLGVLGTIAVGVTLSAAATAPARAQNTNDTEDMQVMVDNFPANIVELCGKIMDLKTVEDFDADAFASAAFANESDPCHEFALRWYALLNGEDDTGSIGDDLAGAAPYGFV